MFCDASEDAIGHVIYFCSISSDNDVHVALVSSGSRLTSRSGIPRLRLSAAAEASKAAAAVVTELETKPSKIYFHFDSKVKLGYLANREGSFAKHTAR